MRNLETRLPTLADDDFFERSEALEVALDEMDSIKYDPPRFSPLPSTLTKPFEYLEMGVVARDDLSRNNTSCLTGEKLRRWTGLGPCSRSACKCNAVG